MWAWERPCRGLGGGFQGAVPGRGGDGEGALCFSGARAGPHSNESVGCTPASKDAQFPLWRPRSRGSEQGAQGVSEGLGFDCHLHEPFIGSLEGREMGGSKGNLQPFLVPVTPSSLFSEQLPSWEEGILKPEGVRPPGPLSAVHLGHHLVLPAAARPVLPQAGPQASSISSPSDAKTAGHGASSGVGQSWDPQRGNFLRSGPCPCPTGRKEPQINPVTPITEVRAEGLDADPSGLAIWG